MVVGVKMLERILWGFGLMATSVALILYARKIVEFTGSSATLEKYLGGGGTYLGLRIFGVLLFFFSIIYTFGFTDRVFGGIARSFFGG